MDDDLTPHPEDAYDRLWRTRYAELDGYRQQVHALANDDTLPVLARVYCAACNTGAKALARVVDTPLGPLLAAIGPHSDQRRSVVAEAKNAGLSIGRPVRVGYVLVGPNRPADRFDWRPLDPEEWPPRVWCERHGERGVDPSRVRLGGTSRIRV